MLPSKRERTQETSRKVHRAGPRIGLPRFGMWRVGYRASEGAGLLRGKAMENAQRRHGFTQRDEGGKGETMARTTEFTTSTLL